MSTEHGALTSSSPRQVEAGDRPPIVLPDRYDDMAYTQQELEAFPAIADMIRVSTDTILPAYLKADQTANRRQRQHRTLTVFAATGGTAAVLLSLIELAGLPGITLPPQAELTMLLVAVASIVLGLFAAAAPGWLLERHKAEHCRLQKFKFLIDPELWTGDSARREARIQQLTDDIKAIADADQEKLDAWMETEEVSPVRAEWPERMLHDGTLRDLVAYYRRNRLANQLGYFRKRKDSFSRREAILKVLPAIMFTTSVLFALGNFAYVGAVGYGLIRPGFGLIAGAASDDSHGAASVDSHGAPIVDSHGAPVVDSHGVAVDAGHGAVAADPHAAASADDHAVPHGPDTLSKVLIVASACLGILASGVRTVRGANEYGRNSSRYAAKYEMLNSVEERLQEGPIDLTVLPYFWHAEQSLEADHRDWLRLMREAEWFG